MMSIVANRPRFGAVVGTLIGISCALSPHLSEATPPAAAVPDQVDGFASDRIIVQLRRGVSQEVFAQRAEAPHRALHAAMAAWPVIGVSRTLEQEPKDGALAAALGLDRYYTIRVAPGTDTPTMARQFGALVDVFDRAEVDPIGGVNGAQFPDDRLWALQNLGQTVNGVVGVLDADIDAVEAWSLATGNPSVVIAVLDTGVSITHPNTAPALVPGASFDPNRPGNPDDNGSISHGTMCAGIAAGAHIVQNNYAGVAWGARIMPVKIASASGASGGTWAGNGVTFAADNNAAILSMSFSFTTLSSFFQSACQYAYGRGCLLVSSSGNTAGNPIGYPAAFDFVMCVGATDSSNNAAAFQQTGPAMDVTAPGVNIYVCVDETSNQNGFRFDNGTSMAAPQVSGLAALVMSASPGISGDRVRQLIETTVDDLGAPGWDPVFGWGKINAERALRAAMNLSRCVADWNNDGSVESDDVAEYIADWTVEQTTGGMATDVDGSGYVDPADVSRFISLWFQALQSGC